MEKIILQRADIEKITDSLVYVDFEPPLSVPRGAGCFVFCLNPKMPKEEQYHFAVILYTDPDGEFYLPEGNYECCRVYPKTKTYHVWEKNS